MRCEIQTGKQNQRGAMKTNRYACMPVRPVTARHSLACRNLLVVDVIGLSRARYLADRHREEEERWEREEL